MENKKQSVKNDYKDHKLRWDLLPLAEIEDIVRVYTAGADKYGPNNWQGLPDGYNRYKGAMLRHLIEYEKGNPVDEETGCLHLAQVAWNAIAMLYFSKRNKEDKQSQLLKALDERIEKKINNCNKILDDIESKTVEVIMNSKLSKTELIELIKKYQQIIYLYNQYPNIL